MRRREFLRLVTIAGLGAPIWMNVRLREALAKIPGNIKITGLKPIIVQNTVFVKIRTSEGVTGLGEGSLGGRTLTVAAAIQEHERLLVGRDPTDIELLWQEMFRWPRERGGPILQCALSAVEIALWDIMGKLLDAPVYKLLGGAARRRIRLYRHANPRDRTPQATAESVKKLVAEGFTAVRTGLLWQPFQNGGPVETPWNLQFAVSLIEAARQAAGDKVDLIDDAHGLMTPVMALEYAKAIEPYRLMFLEDPVKPEDVDGLRWIGEHTTVPLALGESLFTRMAFREFIDRRLISYARPDVIRIGGISEAKKVGAMAEANFIDLALHVAPSPVSNLAAAHVAACTPNCVIVECTGDPNDRPQWTKDLFMGGDIVLKDGYAQLPEKPGLGCDLDETVAAQHPYAPGDLPQMEFPDGSVSDW